MKDLATILKKVPDYLAAIHLALITLNVLLDNDNPKAMDEAVDAWLNNEKLPLALIEQVGFRMGLIGAAILDATKERE